MYYCYLNWIVVIVFRNRVKMHSTSFFLIILLCFTFNQVSSINRVLRNLSHNKQQMSSVPALDVFDNFKILNHQSMWVECAEVHTGESFGKNIPNLFCS